MFCHKGKLLGNRVTVNMKVVVYLHFCRFLGTTVFPYFFLLNLCGAQCLTNEYSVHTHSLNLTFIIYLHLHLKWFHLLILPTSFQVLNRSRQLVIPLIIVILALLCVLWRGRRLRHHLRSGRIGAKSPSRRVLRSSISVW